MTPASDQPPAPPAAPPAEPPAPDDADDDLDLDDSKTIRNLRKENAATRTRLRTQESRATALAEENANLKSALTQAQVAKEEALKLANAETARATALTETIKRRAEDSFIESALMKDGISEAAARKLVPVVRGQLKGEALTFNPKTLDVSGDIATVISEVKADFWKDGSPTPAAPGASGQQTVPVAIPGVPLTGQNPPSRPLTPLEIEQQRRETRVNSLAQGLRSKA